MSADFWSHVRDARRLRRSRRREPRDRKLEDVAPPPYANGAAGGAARKAPGSSAYVGVKETEPGLWRASLSVSGRLVVVGHFRGEEEAARARDRAAVRHHGARAVLNFPESADWREG